MDQKIYHILKKNERKNQTEILHGHLNTNRAVVKGLFKQVQRNYHQLMTSLLAYRLLTLKQTGH